MKLEPSVIMCYLQYELQTSKFKTFQVELFRVNSLILKPPCFHVGVNQLLPESVKKNPTAARICEKNSCYQNLRKKNPAVSRIYEKKPVAARKANKNLS